ncbi:MAG: fumarylacetoacetate hydrolase, partial [Comamonadaceae bacterium]|nr:fumarylacetoacetate hydrolase [Comamonadaceae bacterium]
MKLVRFEKHGQEGWAVQDAATDAWHGLTQGAAAYPGSLDRLVRQGRIALDAAAAVMRAQAVVDLSQATFLVPLAEPRKIICVGLNYRDHTEES